VFQLQSAGPVSDGVIWLEDNAGTMEMGIAETVASNANTIAFPMDQWNLVEWNVSVTGNTFDAFLNGEAFTQISGTIATIIQARLGVMGEDAGTTAGVLYYDQVIVDDLRIRGLDSRFPENTYWVTGNQHLYMGSGSATAYITGTSTDSQVIFYDTDSALNGFPPARIIGVGRTEEDYNSRPVDLHWNRGLYAELSGTDTQAFVTPRSTIWTSEGAAKSFVPRRSPASIV